MLQLITKDHGIKGEDFVYEQTNTKQTRIDQDRQGWITDLDKMS